MAFVTSLQVIDPDIVFKIRNLSALFLDSVVLPFDVSQPNLQRFMYLCLIVQH